MAFPPLTAPGWQSVSDSLQGPDVFLQWISDHIKPNRTVKYFHTNGDVFPGMAVIVDIDGRAHPYDINNPEHENKYAGVVEAKNADNVVLVITHGVLFNATLNWQQGVPYYIASNAYIVTSLTGRFVAVGVDSNRLLIMPSPGSGSVTPVGDNDIDGGFANSVYLMTQIHDGGGA